MRQMVGLLFFFFFQRSGGYQRVPGHQVPCKITMFHNNNMYLLSRDEKKPSFTAFAGQKKYLLNYVVVKIGPW